MKDHIKFILQNSIIFAGISFGFSIIGGLFPSSEHTFVIGNPLEVSGITVEHVVGHIFWGAIIGLGTLSVRYIILGGSFAILLDADHLLQFLDIELVSRMSHSVVLAIIVAIVFFIVLRGKDLRIAAVAFGAVLSHIAFDIFLADVGFNSSTTFPLFSPFILDRIEFAGLDWLGVEIIGVGIVAVVSYLAKRKEIRLENNLTKT
ncbi:MAG: hypothetical protein HN504_05405 [Candidatus Nitrosopelagicus sp.]|jgi:hypothetical protein|nr:hypothetical protein [Candidatus Nitrosopelagicus sp.]